MELQSRAQAEAKRRRGVRVGSRLRQRRHILRVALLGSCLAAMNSGVIEASRPRPNVVGAFGLPFALSSAVTVSVRLF